MTSAISKQGYLVKEGGSTVRNWRKRWFILRNNAIFYMKSPDDATPLGTIYLEDVKVVEKTNEKPQQKFVFTLRGEDNNRTWFLSAASEAELDEWMTTINNAMKEGQQSSFKAISLQHVIVECFIQRGVRVSGQVNPRLLATISHGVTPEKKRRDERGWFCDKHLPIATAINVFVAYGWKLKLTMESVSILSPEDSTPQPANVAIFTRQPLARVLSSASSLDAMSSLTESSESAEVVPQAQVLPKPAKPLPKKPNNGQLNWLLADDEEMQHLMKEMGMEDLLDK